MIQIFLSGQARILEATALFQSFTVFTNKVTLSRFSVHFLKSSEGRQEVLNYRDSGRNQLLRRQDRSRRTNTTIGLMRSRRRLGGQRRAMNHHS